MNELLGAAVKPEPRRAAFVKSDKGSLKSAARLGASQGNARAKAMGARHPCRPHWRKALGIVDTAPFFPRPGKHPGGAIHAQGDPVVGEAGRRPAGVRGGMGKIDADADDEPGALPGVLRRFQQDPGDLAAFKQHVVGPFAGDAKARPGGFFDHLDDGKGGDEGKPRRRHHRPRRRGEKAGVEVARKRCPGAAMAASALALSAGDEPLRPDTVCAEAPPRLFIGAVDVVEEDEGRQSLACFAGGIGRALSAQPNKAPAARALIAKTGAPTSTPTGEVARAVPNRSAREPKSSTGSKGVAGSSKYITLTTRK